MAKRRGRGERLPEGHKGKTTCQTNNLLTEATAPGAAAMKAAITAEMKRSFIFEIAMCFGFDVCFLLCKIYGKMRSGGGGEPTTVT